jgi:hypothetical protein
VQTPDDNKIQGQQVWMFHCAQSQDS